MKKLVLVGCVHNDPYLGKRLSSALTKYEPAAVTLEWSDDRNKLFANQLPPMVATTQEYCKQKSIPLQNVDMYWQKRALPDMAAFLFRGSEVTKSIAALAQKYAAIYGNSLPQEIQTRIMSCPFLDLTEFGIAVSSDTLYRIVQAFRAGQIPTQAMIKYLTEGGSSTIADDSAMAKLIRTDFFSLRDGPLVHVGGLVHYAEIEGYNTLANLLRDLNPSIELAVDFD